MKISIDTTEILEQLKEDMKEEVDYIVDTEIRRIIRGEIYGAVREEMDHIEETPYNLIHHRVYAMLDKYIEKEVEERIINQSDEYRKLRELCERAEKCCKEMKGHLAFIDGETDGNRRKSE